MTKSNAKRHVGDGPQDSSSADSDRLLLPLLGPNKGTMQNPVPSIGPYVVVEEMGRGGSGVVWKGRHEVTGISAAVKVAGDSSRRQGDLLRREISMLSRLGRTRHAGIITIVESGIDCGRLWYAMEFIEGMDLRFLVRRRRMADPPGTGEPTRRGHGTSLAATTTMSSGEVPSPAPLRSPEIRFYPSQRDGSGGSQALPAVGCDDALWIMAQVADALALLHGEGIVHGDLTPANIMLRPDLTPVLVDFGTAFHASAGSTAREVVQVEGISLGTPGYMAPEQIRKDRLDARCDLYAFGCILYELLYGCPPFEADTVPGLLHQHLHHALPDRLAPMTSFEAELAPLITALLEKDPRRRLGHAGEVMLRLQKLYHGNLPFPRTRSTSGLYRSRLVGRDEPLTRVTEMLRRTREGHGDRLLIVGESGVGKTRLLNEASAKAIELGMHVVSGQCADLAGEGVPVPGPALHGFVPFLQGYADRAAVDTSLCEDTLDALTLLGRYEPALSALARDKSDDCPKLPPDLGFVRVMRALATVVRRFAQEQPLLLVLDDLQWADELTLSFWFSDEALKLRDSPITILAASREVRGAGRLETWLSGRPPEVLRLSRLRLDEIRVVAREMLGVDLVPPGLVEALETPTDGNPFFIAEYLRAFVTRGRLKLSPTGWVFSEVETTSSDDDRAPSDPVPLPLRDLFQVRFAGLEPDSQNMLRLAAVLGREFHRDLLLGVVTSMRLEPSDRAEVALDQLVGRQILEEIGDERYRFVHDQLREAVLRLIDPKQFTTLNHEIANCFEFLRSSVPQITDAQIGLHLANAGDASAALPYLEGAAAEAEAGYAVSRAIELYRLALKQAEILDYPHDAVDAPERRIAEALADVLARSARHSETRSLYRRALSTLPMPRSTAACRLLRKEAQSHWTVHQYDDANHLLDQAEARFPVETARNAEDWNEWIELQQARFWTLYYSRRTGPETIRLIERLSPIVLQYGTSLQRSMAHQCAAADLAGRIRYVYSEEVLAHSRRSLDELGASAAFALERASARFQIGFGLVRGGLEECQAAADLLAQVALEADRMGDATLLARARTYQAVALRRTGDVHGTEHAARDAFAAGEAAQLFPYMGAAEACQAWVTWRSGKVQDAATRAQTAVEWWRRSAHAFPFRWLANLLLLDWYCSNEDFDLARATVSDLLAPDQQVLAESLWSSLHSASLALDGGEPSQIGKTLRQVLCQAHVQRYL